jgi:hypothetical protein
MIAVMVGTEDEINLWYFCRTERCRHHALVRKFVPMIPLGRLARPRTTSLSAAPVIFRYSIGTSELKPAWRRRISAKRGACRSETKIRDGRLPRFF